MKDCHRDERIDKEFVIKASDFEITRDEDLELVDDIVIIGDVRLMDNDLKIDFRVMAKFDFICSRCLNI